MQVVGGGVTPWSGGKIRGGQMGDHSEGVACAQWDHYRLHKSWALRQGGWWDQETEEDPQDSPHFLQGWREILSPHS